jgi:hypothetical protein
VSEAEEVARRRAPSRLWRETVDTDGDAHLVVRAAARLAAWMHGMLGRRWCGKVGRGTKNLYFYDKKNVFSSFFNML